MFIYFIFRLIKSPKLKFRLKKLHDYTDCDTLKVKIFAHTLLSGYSTLIRHAKGPNLLRVQSFMTLSSP